VVLSNAPADKTRSSTSVSTPSQRMVARLDEPIAHANIVTLSAVATLCRRTTIFLCTLHRRSVVRMFDANVAANTPSTISAIYRRTTIFTCRAHLRGAARIFALQM